MPRRRKGEHARALIARFLHYFPQYTLRDLQDGTLSLGEFRMLLAGMTDNTNPEVTMPLEELVSQRVREMHLRHKKRSW